MVRTIRPAVTLPELLVCVGVLSIMLALLMPAVQKVRFAAARMACQSNLKQISLATLNYESAFGELPPAIRKPKLHRVITEPYLQWPLLIAPQLEQEAAHREALEDFARSKDPFLPSPHRAVSRPLKSFGCPLDPRVTVAQSYTFEYTLAKPKPKIMTQQVALNSYLGSAGTKASVRDGVIVADGGVTMLSITDGTSNTIAFGERPPTRNFRWGWLYVGWGAGWRGAYSSVIGVQDRNLFYDYEVEAERRKCGRGPFPFRQPDLHAEVDCGEFQFWSLHSGGANFAFADGSVRLVPYTADSVLPALATRAGGEVVDLP